MNIELKAGRWVVKDDDGVEFEVTVSKKEIAERPVLPYKEGDTVLMQQVFGPPNILKGVVDEFKFRDGRWYVYIKVKGDRPFGTLAREFNTTDCVFVDEAAFIRASLGEEAAAAYIRGTQQ